MQCRYDLDAIQKKNLKLKGNLTSTAPQMSFSVLHRERPSVIAPAISSMYFSRVSVSISFKIWSLFSIARDCRILLTKAVCRLREESSLAVSEGRS